MKSIPKTPRGKANRLRDMYQRKAGVRSFGIVKSRSGNFIFEASCTKSMYDEIKKTCIAMGGKTAVGANIGGGETIYYFIFS